MALLAALPGMSGHTLALLSANNEVAEAAEALGRGALGPLARIPGAGGAAAKNGWKALAKSAQPREVISAFGRAGASMLSSRHRFYPDRLRHLLLPPVLAVRGNAASLIGLPTVAVVGTADCTAYGGDVARSVARELACEGVAVLSAEGRGIQAAASRGASEAARAPSVLVRTHLDLPQLGQGQRAELAGVAPGRRAGRVPLVRQSPVELSASPAGSGAELLERRAKEELIANLAEVVVVVECFMNDRVMALAELAAERGATVMAVPGSIRSPASRGPNALLSAGCHPCTATEDVVAALSLAGAGNGASWEHLGLAT